MSVEEKVEQNDATHTIKVSHFTLWAFEFMKKQTVFKLSPLSASILALSLVNGAWGG